MKKLCLVLLLLVLCIGFGTAHAETAPAYTLWIPYWNYQEAIDEAVSCKDELRAVIAFGAVFDKQENLLLLPGMEETISGLKKSFAGKVPIYLSVINDVQTLTGFDNKTTDILESLFESEETMDQHVDDLIDLAIAQGVDGIEIDYEAMKDDCVLWEKYAVFLEKLYKKTQENGFLLRSVLAWDTAKYASMPMGPEYTVMCYNLYGYHSGPGPKADMAFLNETYQLCLGLPGEVCMAFATGGFEWDQNNKVSQITQGDASTTTFFYGQTPVRDENSGAMTFSYAEKGKTKTVWYADGLTLQMWRDQAIQNGYQYFDLFCAGGNLISDWEETLFQPFAVPMQSPMPTQSPVPTTTPNTGVDIYF